MHVAVGVLKAKLSTYLKRAAAGERITVTDRGRPVAVLGPMPGAVDLSIGVAEGWITPASATGLPAIPRHPAVRSTSAVLEEDRAE